MTNVWNVLMAHHQVVLNAWSLWDWCVAIVLIV